MRQKLAKLTLEHTIELEDAVVVNRDKDGRVRPHQARNPVARCAAGGALSGGVIGLPFLVPQFGMLIGAGAGGASGAMVDVGISDQFMKDLGAKLSREERP